MFSGGQAPRLSTRRFRQARAPVLHRNITPQPAQVPLASIDHVRDRAERNRGRYEADARRIEIAIACTRDRASESGNSDDDESEYGAAAEADDAFPNIHLSILIQFAVTGSSGGTSIVERFAARTKRMRAMNVSFA